MGNFCSGVESSDPDLEKHLDSKYRLEHTPQLPDKVAHAPPAIQGPHDQHNELELSNNGPGGTVIFTYEELATLTGSFSNDCLVGGDAFGEVYMAEIRDQKVAIKRLIYEASEQQREADFIKVVEALMMVDHENLVKLIGYCCQGTKRLIVCEYCPNLSLRLHLHGNQGANRTLLNWDTRINIALGAARAIAHLHSLDPLTCHGSIKGSNVLLTSSFDYGFARFIGPTLGDALVATNRTNGYFLKKKKEDYGYRAPEVIFTTRVSQKADVYSFGVLFLELLTGKDPNESHLEDEEMDLPRWILSAINNEWTSEVFDVELLQCGNLEELMLQLLELAFSCTSQNPENRPSMVEVTSQIELLCGNRLRNTC